jgi:aspartate aminotransferase
MTAGEPDFDSPECARIAAKRLIDEGEVRYTAAAGRADLREAIASHLTRSRGVAFEASGITVCHSAKHALAGVLISLVHPGDEVLLLRPAWVSYDAQVRFAGGRPVTVAPRSDMGPDFDALEAAVGAGTRGLILNSPNNPSGFVATAAELTRLVEFAEAHNLWILSDEIYSRLVYAGEPFASPVQCGEAGRARTVIIDGASKCFAMTGYRIGYVATEKRLAATVGRLHSQLTGAPNSVSQAALLAALSEDPPEVAAMQEELDNRRRLVLTKLAAMGLETSIPRGAFYVFPSILKVQPNGDSEAFCERLLEEQGLAAVPGSAFGLDGHIRLSYATSLEKIDAGLDLLAAHIHA